MGRGDESLIAKSRSHDQDGRHTHIWLKPLKNLLFQNWWADFHETLYVAFGTLDDLDLFYGKVKFGNIGFYIGKSENYGFFENYCSLRPEKW